MCTTSRKRRTSTLRTSPPAYRPRDKRPARHPMGRGRGAARSTILSRVHMSSSLRRGHCLHGCHRRCSPPAQGVQHRCLKPSPPFRICRGRVA
eukprot:5578536-Pleurochrysis_carterae.AAC.1